VTDIENYGILNYKIIRSSQVYYFNISMKLLKCTTQNYTKEFT